MKDITKQVLFIVETLENPPEYCQECECVVDTDETTICPDCGCETSPMSAFDYLRDALDIEWTLGSDKQLLGARILVCFGGPNVWIDTRYNRVDGHWWQDKYDAAYIDNMGLDEAIDELWECQ